MKTKNKIGTLIMGLTMALGLNAAEVQPEHNLGLGVLSHDTEAKLLDRCIDLAANESFFSDVRQTSYALHMVKSKEELYDKINSSTSGGGSYLSFSGSAKVKFMREKKWEENNVYIFVKTQRITNKKRIGKDTLLIKDEKRNIALDSIERFSQSCGDRFISEIEYGGEFFGILEVKTKSYQEKQKLEMDVKASGNLGVGSGSGSSSYKRLITQLKTHHTIYYTLMHIGGSIIDIPNAEEELLTVASEIEKNSDAHPVQLGSHTRDYMTISNFPFDPNSWEIQERQDFIDEAENKLLYARTDLANGKYVIAFPKDFIMMGFDKAQLEIELNSIEDYISALKTEKEKAKSFTNKIDKDILKRMPQINLPKKKMWERDEQLKVKCEEKQSSICGVEKYKKIESRFCGIASPKIGTGPACNPIFVEKKHEDCGVKTFRIDRSKACPKKQRKKGCQVVEEYNTCRLQQFGIEKYETCASPAFGYNYNSCEHIFHGPESFNTCDVTTIGRSEHFCPDL